MRFAREGLRLNPSDFTAMSMLGVNLLRLGEEEEGKATLEKAFSGDPFNVLNVNTLTLLDSFENFDQFEIPNFKVKLHKKESAVLRPYVTDLLERAYNTLSEKYHFKPEGPITFEMYPDHADFAVRTFGLPGIGGIWVSASESSLSWIHRQRASPTLSTGAAPSGMNSRTSSRFR